MITRSFLCLAIVLCAYATARSSIPDWQPLVTGDSLTDLSADMWNEDLDDAPCKPSRVNLDFGAAFSAVPGMELDGLPESFVLNREEMIFPPEVVGEPPIAQKAWTCKDLQNTQIIVRQFPSGQFIAYAIKKLDDQTLILMAGPYQDVAEAECHRLYRRLNPQNAAELKAEQLARGQNIVFDPLRPYGCGFAIYKRL